MTSEEHAIPSQSLLRRLARQALRVIVGMARALGWFYGVALAAAALALWAFEELAEHVLRRQADAMNRAILSDIHELAPLRWKPAMLAITDIGSFYGITAVGGVLILWLLRTRRTIDAVTCFVAMSGGGILSLVLKRLFREPRPTVFTPMTVAHGFSFPSGHSLESFCLYGFIAVWLLMQRPAGIGRWTAALFCLLVPLVVAFSRMFLGVHWPTDVTAGILVAVAWLAVCFSARQWYRDRMLRRQSL
jgi:membrane-associated phospholipid phosphatase